jgi:hypothetical protein
MPRNSNGNASSQQVSELIFTNKTVVLNSQEDNSPSLSNSRAFSHPVSLLLIA